MANNDKYSDINWGNYLIGRGCLLPDSPEDLVYSHPIQYITVQYTVLQYSKVKYSTYWCYHCIVQNTDSTVALTSSAV